MPWRDYLVPASYNNCPFFVEASAKAGGRRNVDHEYPKRDTPYAEDMGRRGKRFSIQAYIIGPEYVAEADALDDAMDQAGPGLLVLPNGNEFLVNPDGCNRQESRLRGGIAEFDLTFIEAGSPGNLIGAAATQSNVQSQAGAAGTAAAGSADAGLRSAGAGSSGAIST